MDDVEKVRDDSGNLLSGGKGQQQLVRFNALLDEILISNAFYQKKLKGVKVPLSSWEEYIASVPFTTKDELAEDHASHPPYGTTHTYPLHRYSRFHQTSGTRGTPLIWLDDAASWKWIEQGWAWVWQKTGVGEGDCAFFPFSFGPFLGFWGAYEAAAGLGVRVVPGGGMSSEDRIQLLERCEANILCCTPTYALRLAEVARNLSVSLDTLNVEKVLVCGEPGGSIPEVRARIEEAWGARVIDHHGMTEVGPVTVSDSQNSDQLLINQQRYFAEVINPGTRAAVTEGEVGELVLTTLGRPGSPLFRYRTGDLVKPICENGRVIALEGGIIGRADDMVVVRGVNVYPSAVEALVRSIDGIAEYQVVVDQRGALPELHVSVEATAEVATALEKRFREVLSLRVPVNALAEGSLPVFEVKAKRWQIEP